LLPHDIITYGLNTAATVSQATSELPVSSLSAVTMSVPSPFASLQQTAMKELPKFTGEPDQKVAQFVDAIEHIGTLTEWTEPALHTLAAIKLGGLAFNWYNNNKDTLRTWPSLKAHLLERFQPSISIIKTRLKTRRQQPDESLSTFYDDIIELCKQVDKDMPIYMIVDYLQDGVRDDLKVHIKRRMATIADAPSPALFLKIARAEDELQKDVAAAPPPSLFSQPYFGHVAVATNTSTAVSPHYHAPATSTSTSAPRVPFRTTPPTSSHSGHPNSAPRYRPCLICDKTNHRTIDCSGKQPSGCFKCGDPAHVIRACPQVFR
jgi:hypothetical protein